MTKTIKLNETSKFLRKDNATHVLWQKWDEDEIVVLKRWKMEEMLDPDGPINYSKFWNRKYDNDGFLTFTNLHKPKGPFGWWSPQWLMQEAGFVYEGLIDVKLLFCDYLKKDVVHKDGIVRVPFMYVPWTWRDLRKVRVQLEEELDKFGYKDRDLIIYRTIKASLTNWDFIEVFSEKRVPVESKAN